MALRSTSSMCLVLLACVAGCSSDDDAATDTTTAGGRVVQLGAPGETARALTDEEAAAIAAPGHVEADVRFLHDMIAHHQQALEMTAFVEERTSNPDIQALAERIDASQAAEIEQFQQWLVARNEPATAGEHAGHGSETMPGMLIPEEMEQLAGARDSEFDELFLQYMIRHHEGALTMVGQLFEDGGGQESEIFQITGHVESDQSLEISRMRNVLVDL